jgi:FAD/FMN-containing dehydrogenase
MQEPATAHLVAELKREMGSRVITGAAGLNPFTRDFGGLQRRVPLVAVYPRSEAEVQEVLRLASAAGVPVTVRGAGHSCNGRGLNEGGVLLVSCSNESPLTFLPDGCVRLSARSRWAGVVRSLHRQGRSAPVLTNHLGTTVGGTLSVGGFGIASVKYGAQLDHVESLRVLNFAGDAVDCSRNVNPELFAHALGGFGEAGLIESAVIKTVPYCPSALFSIVYHHSLTQLVRGMKPLSEDASLPDYFFAESKGTGYLAFYGLDTGHDQLHDLARRQWPSAAERTIRELESFYDFEQQPGNWERFRHIWSDYCLDFDGLLKFAEHIDLGLSLGALQPYLSRVYLLCLAPPRHAMLSPFEPRPSLTQRTFGIGVYYTVPVADVSAAAQAQSIQDALLAKCLEIGGRPYGWGYCGRRAE